MSGVGHEQVSSPKSHLLLVREKHSLCVPVAVAGSEDASGCLEGTGGSGKG